MFFGWLDTFFRPGLHTNGRRNAHELRVELQRGSYPQYTGFHVTGADHKNYIYRVKKMKEFIPSVFGPADLKYGSDATASVFSGKKGIILFDVPFSDASGHVTLWNGLKAVDEDYFSDQNRHGRPLIDVALWVCP